MISKDMLLKFFAFFSFYLIGMLLFQFLLIKILLGILGYMGAEFYLIVLNREEILRGTPIASLNLIDTDVLPNTLLVDNNQSLYAITGLLFFSTVATEDYLDRLRFQDQFSIIHLESQCGSIYLVINELLLTKPWNNLGEEMQSYYLKQTCKHLCNVQGVLNELIPGFKMRLLSITELSEECGFTDFLRAPSTSIPNSSEQPQIKVQSEGLENTLSSTRPLSTKSKLLHKLRF